jgi:hypothetical protein
MTSLRQRFIEDMQVRNFSPVTQASYTREISGFARGSRRTATGRTETDKGNAVNLALRPSFHGYKIT